ncbi:ABC transporter permease [Homoserinimonas sp. A447]
MSLAPRTETFEAVLLPRKGAVGQVGQRLALIVGLVVLALIVIAAVFGPSLVPSEASELGLRDRLLEPGTMGSQMFHIFGTDSLGRDVLGLLILGARPALLISLAAVGIAAVVGLLLGVVTGYVGGRVGDLLIFITNTQLAFPFFLMAITIVGIFRPSVPLVVAVIALGTWVPFARVTYTETLQVREMEFIEAVKVMRGGVFRIVARHIFPNVMPSVIVLATLAFGTAIITESSLSFVGLGAPTEFPTWGRILSEGRDYVATAWWLTTLPGVAIFVLVLSVNVVGESLRERLDPKLRRG